MKKTFSVMLVLMLMAVGLLSAGRTAFADEIKVVGIIQTIEVAKDGNSATVVLKDEKNDTSVTVRVDDELTLNKFKDHRIVEGDEIRLKYEPQGAVNHSTYFRKTAGC